MQGYEVPASKHPRAGQEEEAFINARALSGHLGEDISAQVIAENFRTVPLEYEKPWESHLKVNPQN